MAVTIREQVPGGIHFRLPTPHGPVHVLVTSSGPPLPGPTIYIHGFYDSVDQAMTKFRLLEQAQATGRSGVFVFPEAPTGNGQAINFTDLESLLAAVRQDTGLAMSGPVTAIAHSGAFSTALAWLKDPRLARVVLLDALYAGVAQFLAWGGQPGRVLDIVVTKSGAPRTNAEKVAPQIAALAARGAGSYLLSPLSHFALVTPPTSLLPDLIRSAPARAQAIGLLVAAAAAGTALWLWMR